MVEFYMGVLSSILVYFVLRRDGLGDYKSQVGVGVYVLLNYMGQVSKVQLKS